MADLLEFELVVQVLIIAEEENFETVQTNFDILHYVMGCSNLGFGSLKVICIATNISKSDDSLDIVLSNE